MLHSLLFFFFGAISAIPIAVYYFRKESLKLNQQKEFFETERKSIAKAERFAALGDFGAGIAHEINNPLAIILGRTQALKIRLDRDKYEKKDIVDTVDKIEVAVKRISKIVNALRLMTKDSSDETASLVSITLFLEDIESVWAARLRNSGIEFKIENNCSDLMTFTKRTQVAHALFNIISNSFDFLKSISEASEKWIKIDINEKSGFVQIGISDSGPGIPIETRQKIFDPFFTTKEVGKGSGLGLSIAKGVAEDNNGRLEYDEHSSNTRFILSLPKVEAAQNVAS